MTWALARPVLVSIVKAAAPTTKSQGLGAAFVHDTAINDRIHGAHRHFGIMLRQLRRLGPAQMVANCVAVVVAVVVDYPDSEDASAIDAAIGADYEVISRALAAQDSWARSTSSIRCVGADSESSPDAALFDAEVVDVEGGKRLVITFPVEFSS